MAAKESEMKAMNDVTCYNKGLKEYDPVHGDRHRKSGLDHIQQVDESLLREIVETDESAKTNEENYQKDENGLRISEVALMLL